MYVTLQSSTCFEHRHAHLQEDQLYYHSIWYRHSLSTRIRHTVQPFTESDDTRCCDNTIFPPEDGHVNARNVSRIVM
jgi:SRSO17 transposase